MTASRKRRSSSLLRVSPSSFSVTVLSPIYAKRQNFLRLSNKFDPGVVTFGAGEPAVAGDERRIERFSEGDIDGIVSRHICPQFPRAGQKNVVGVPAQRKQEPIVEGRPAPLRVDLAGCCIPAEHLRYLDVDQVWCMKCLSGLKEPRFDCGSRRRLQQNFEDRRSIDDDHRLSRSARTAFAGATLGLAAARLDKTARNSSMVGRSAR